MDDSILNTITSSINSVTDFFFNSYTGVCILIMLVIILSLIIAIILERKTKREFKNHPIESETKQNDDKQ